MKGNIVRPQGNKVNLSFSKSGSGFQQKNKFGVNDQKAGSVVAICDKLITISLFMIFLGIPIFFTGLTFQGIVFEKQIYFYFWTLLASVVWVSKGVIVGEMKIRKTPLDFMIAGFWLVCVISAIFSVDRWHSFWGFFGDPSRGVFNLTAIIIIYYVMLSNFNAKRLKWMIIGLTSSIAIVSCWSLLAVLNVPFIPEAIRKTVPLSLTGTMTGLRVFIGLSIPFLMMMILRPTDNEKAGKLKNITTPLLLLVLLVNFFVLTALYDKIATVIVILGIGFFLVYIVSHIVRPRKNAAWLPIAAFILSMIVFMIGPNDISRIDVPLEVSPNSKISWEIAKGGLKTDAFLGSGPATYGYDFSMYRPQEFNNNAFYNLRFYQGTGIFFESISTIGVLGVVALLLLVLSFFGIIFYLLSKDKSKNKIYSLGILSSLLVLVVASFIFRLEGTLLILGGLLGSLAIGIIFQESDVEPEYLNLSLKASPKFALALAFVFIVVSAGVAVLIVFIGKVYLADVYAGKGAREAEITNDGSIRMISKAYVLNKREGRYSLRASQEYMALANSEILSAGSTVDEDRVRRVQEYANRSIEFAKEGARLMQNDVLAVSVLAQIYESAGVYAPEMLSLAEENYRKALELEPHNPIFYLKIGQFKLSLAAKEEDENKRQKMIEEAKENLEKSIEKKGNFAAAHYNLAVAHEALGNKKEAIASNINAILIDKNNNEYLFNLGRLYQSRGEGADNENARKIYEFMLANSANNVNVNFNLGVLYEKIGENDLAIKRYEKVLDLVSNEKADIKKQIEKMIENVRAGISNVSSASPSTEPIVEEEVDEQADLIGPEQVQEIDSEQPAGGEGEGSQSESTDDAVVDEIEQETTESETESGQ